MEGNREIFTRAISKWGNGASIDNVLENSNVDWTMVKFEMSKQVEAKDTVYGSSVHGNLSDTSIAIKISQPNFYQALHKFALSKNLTSENEIELEINRQVDAFMKTVKLKERYSIAGEKVFLQTLKENSIGATKENLFQNPTIDWVALYKEMKNTLEPPRPVLKPRN